MFTTILSFDKMTTKKNTRLVKVGVRGLKKLHNSLRIDISETNSPPNIPIFTIKIKQFSQYQNKLRGCNV